MMGRRQARRWVAVWVGLALVVLLGVAAVVALVGRQRAAYLDLGHPGQRPEPQAAGEVWTWWGEIPPAWCWNWDARSSG